MHSQSLSKLGVARLERGGLAPGTNPPSLKTSHAEKRLRERYDIEISLINKLGERGWGQTAYASSPPLLRETYQPLEE